MKPILKTGLLCTIVFSALSVVAQNPDNRPKLFSSVSNKIDYRKAELRNLFKRKQGTSFQLSLNGNSNFAGTILSSVQKYPNLKTVIIKSDGANATVFGVSEITNDDKSITYVGRLTNEKFSDGFELQHDNAGNYFLRKIDLQDRND
ncbi:MAG: hypothetical protein ABIR81_11675 [Ginsengibacter sp.]